MRDIYRDKEYFDEFILKLHSNIDKQFLKFSNNLVRNERLDSSKKNLTENHLRLLRAKYSKGDSMIIKEVITIYDTMVSLFCEYSKNNNLNKIKIKKDKEICTLNQYTFSSFLLIMDILSLGILIDNKDENFFKISKIIDNDDVKDFLLEILLSFKIKNRKSIDEESYENENFMHINKRYQLLKEIIKENDKEKAQNKLMVFLQKKWYQSFKGTGYYNQHKNKFNVYSGYWCFIAAAIVKIKNLDDSSFRDNPYYPKDLV